MKTCTDIRDQVLADARLQKEISHALLAVADALAAGGDRRIVRILTRTLEASWTEHVSFQDEVVFPILVSRHGSTIKDLLQSRHCEHVHLAKLHAEIGHHLEELLGPGHKTADGLESLLRRTHELRLSHLEFDFQLNDLLPEVFSDAERTLCEKWSKTRPNLRFPLNLLRNGSPPYPRLGGGRVH
jgi:hypothetical protein